MQPEQKALYYITGGAESMLRKSPLLEIYKKKDIEVLILDDEIDEIVFSSVPTSTATSNSRPSTSPPPATT